MGICDRMIQFQLLRDQKSKSISAYKYLQFQDNFIALSVYVWVWHHKMANFMACSSHRATSKAV